MLRALQKDPAHRFADADEFIARARGRRAASPPGPASTRGSRRTPATYPGCRRVAELEARRPPQPALAVVAAGRCSRSPAIAVGAYLLLAPEKVAVPDVVGRRSATAAQILQNRGLRGQRSRTCAPTACPRTASPRSDPQPGQEAEEGSTVTIIVSERAGRRDDPVRRAARRARRPSGS